MNRNIALAKRMREVLLDGQWIANINYKQEIQNLRWQQAVHKTGNFNTIAVLTYHINYYLAGLLFAFENGRLEISDKYSFDLSAEFTEENWANLVSDFFKQCRKVFKICGANG